MADPCPDSIVRRSSGTRSRCTVAARTGRAGRKGTAVTLASRGEDKFLRAIEELIGERICARLVDGFDYMADTSQPEVSQGPAARRSDMVLDYLSWRYGSRTPAPATAASGRARGRR